MKNKHVITQKQWVTRAIAAVLFFVGLGLLARDSNHGGIEQAIGCAFLAGLVVWGYLHCRNSQDEVVRAANVAAMAIGAPVALGVAFVSIFIVRFHPEAARMVNTLAGGAHASWGPGAAGFGLGVLFTCAIVVLGACLAWAGWWAAKR